MPISTLRIASIIYLLLPNLIFAVGWFRPPYSILLLLGWLALFWLEFGKKKQGPLLNRREIFFLFLFALSWTLLSGVGGYFHQSSDFFAHHAKFYDLYQNPWPNYFPEVDRYSCYYFGYFLVPALLSKGFHTLLPSALVIWSVIGYTLAVAWLYLLTQRSKIFLFALLWVRGIGHILVFVIKKTLLVAAPFYMPLMRSIFDQSGWVPNQLIPSVLVTCILLYDAFVIKRIQDSFFPLSLLLIWAIFPSIMLFLLYTVLLVHKYLVEGRFREIVRAKAIAWYWIPAVLVIPNMVFLLSSDSTPMYGLLWVFDQPLRISFNYFIGFLLDWALFYFLLLVIQKRAGWLPLWFVHSLFYLMLVASLFRMGLNNDWFYRGQIPFFIIILVGVFNGLRVYWQSGSSPLIKTIAGILIIAGCIQMVYSSDKLRNNAIVAKFFPQYTHFKPFPYDQFSNTYEALVYLHPDKDDSKQYSGKKGSFYELYLARKGGE